jgi:multiple sugar transport system permease protein
MAMSLRGRIDDFLRKPYAMAYIFIFPTFFLLFVFHVLPFISSFYVSMLNMQVSFDTAKFVGLAHFKQALGDRYFINALKVTMKFVFFEIPWQMAVGLVFSAMVAKNSPFNKLMRGIYFLPIVVSATALGIMWGFILHSNIGLITHWLDVLGFGKINFLNSVTDSFKTVIFVVVWRSFGMTTLIMVASMQNVSDDLYDAAEVDGASKVRQFWSITLPSIMPTIWFILMTRIMSALQIFDIIFTLTGGGPNYTTETVVAYVYRKSMDGTSNMGYATAMCEFLFAIILVITIIQYTIMTKTEN